MSFIGNTIGKIVGGITGANQQADAIKDGAATQAASAQAGIDQQKEMLAVFQKVLDPYVKAGYSALGGQQDLLGVNGAPAQEAAIGGVQASPQFQALAQQGEDAILANASATGGLRGGNTQGTLAQFRPQLLAQLIEQQYQRLGGLTTVGANAAAGVGTAGLNTGQSVAQLLQQQGAATAGGQVAAGGTTRQAFGNLLQLGALGYGLSGLGAPAAAAGATPAMVAAGQF